VTLSTERPSWRSRLHRVLVRSAIGIFVLVCLTYVCEYAIEWHRRERLEKLVQSIKTLQVGVTTDEEVRALSERYGGRFTPEGTFTEPRTSTYSLDFSSPYIRGADGFHTLPGRRVWFVSVELTIKERRLEQEWVRFVVARSDGVLLVHAVQVASHDLHGENYVIFEPHTTGPPSEGFKVYLTPKATPAEHETAFRFNYSCLTGLRECRHTCDFAPDVWHEPRRLHPGERGDSMDADCRQSAQ
jgi:hypothetical protein